MATQYNGFVSIDTSSYYNWKAATLGNGYNYDGSYGDQCWDYCQEFWANLGSTLSTGGTGYAYGCWTVARETNAGNLFDLITSKSEIRIGDVIVMNKTSSNSAGHITFADENYNGTDYIYCLGQNQGGPAYSGGGTYVSVNRLGLDAFLGAFRYKGWSSSSGSLSGGGNYTPSNGHFPWVLYARGLRKKQ